MRFRAGIFSLFFVYLVWGSSFLGIRVAVTGEGAFAPYTLAAVRTGFAALLLLGFSLARGFSFVMSARAFLWLALTGCVLWIGGHALVIWAERRMDSSLAALIFASVPLWGALLEGLRTRKLPFIWPVILGFVGVALVLPFGGASLLWPDSIVLLFSAFLWSLGSVMGEGPARGVPLTVSTGVQLLVASVVSIGIAAVAGETLAPVSARAMGAAAYLIFFGTVLAYLAYAHTMRTLPSSWVMSFGYVNPVVAVVLGFLVLGESIAPRALAGMAVVIGSVVWLFAHKGEVT